MMKTRFVLLVAIVLSGLVLFAGGCSINSPTTSNAPATISITSSIEKYSLFMSSVPGFPLLAVADPAADPDQTEFLWKTTAGSFSSWGQGTDYKVTDLGSEYTGGNNLVYYAPPIEAEIPAEGIQVTVEARNADTHEMIGQALIFIDYSNFYFSIR